MKRAILVLVIFSLIALPNIASAQNSDLIPERTAGNFFGVGARAMGMGGAHIAAVMDGTALIYNPAALARIRRIEVLGGISHQNLDNAVDPGTLGSALGGYNDRGQNNTRLNAINLSVPYPTYRGSLVFAFGINRVKSFDKTFEVGYHYLDQDVPVDVIGTEAETGSIYALSAGAGIDLSPNISIGATLNYYFGPDNYSWQVVARSSNQPYSPVIRDNIEDDYSAVSAKIGFLVAPNDILKIGATVESPIQYNIDETYSQRTYFEDGTSTADYGKYSYDLWTPFSFGAGMALNLNYLQLAADIKYTDWTQMEYKNNLALEIDNIDIQTFYRDVFGFSLGAEYLIPKVGLKIRGGFLSDPLPFSDNVLITGDVTPLQIGTKIIDDRKFYTFGFGYLIDRVMTLDVAVVLGGYKIQDLETTVTEDYDLSRIYVSTGFRL